MESASSASPIEQKFPTESQARKAVASCVFSINVETSKTIPVTFGVVIRRYLAEEIPERHSLLQILHPGPPLVACENTSPVLDVS